MEYFDLKKWEDLIKSPDWYFGIAQEYSELLSLKEKDKESYEKWKEKIYDFFETHLKNGDVALAEKGKDFDSERKPIDTIIVHHTSNNPGITRERLSAIGLVRLYVPYFVNPAYAKDKEIKGLPIYSGHFRSKRQVFYPYHWIIRQNGEKEKLLLDNEIGWHSGNWDVNCRSIGIVLDNDYENSIPSDAELKAIADVIKENYLWIGKENIFGHREINKKKTCPSNLFLGESGWKNKLLGFV